MDNDNRDTVNVNEADAIFIPSDIEGDKTDYTTYKTSMFRTVPANCYLVSENIFTRKVINRGGRGFKFMAPFVTRSILVPNIDRTIDYKKIEYQTRDGIMANVDMALSVKIVDPRKYIVSGKFQLSQLNVLAQSLLRVYIQNRSFDHISSGVCPLADFDPRDDFRGFEENYGIRVNRVLLKEVKLPKELEDEYNERVANERKRESQRVKLAAEKDRAEREAEIIEIKAEAEAKKIRKIEEAKAEVYLEKMRNLVTYLKNEGVPVEEISEQIRNMIAADSGNAIFMGGNRRSSDIAMGVAAGNAVRNHHNTNNTQGVNNVRVADRLLNDLRAYVLLGQYSQESFQELSSRLLDEEMKRNLDSLDQGSYSNLLNNLLANDRIGSRTNENNNPNVRTR